MVSVRTFEQLPAIMSGAQPKGIHSQQHYIVDSEFNKFPELEGEYIINSSAGLRPAVYLLSICFQRTLRRILQIDITLT